MAITAPKITVLMDDGKEYDVKMTYKAQMQYGRTARVRKWPSADDAPEMAMNFMLWFVLTQQLGYYEYPYEEFEDHVEWAEQHEEELTEGDEDFPTKTFEEASSL